MTYLSIIEKLKILFNMMLDNKIVLIFLIAVIAISLLYFIKVISYKKSISLILIALIITLITSISTNYKVLSGTFDNFMTILFSNIYFPSIYVYLVILLISMIVFIVSLFNTILKKSYKIVNNIFFIMNSILFIIIINIIAKNKLDVFSNTMYSNINLVSILEINMIIFLLWIGSLIVIYTTDVISVQLVNKKVNKKEVTTSGIEVYNSFIGDSTPNNIEVDTSMVNDDVYNTNDTKEAETPISYNENIDKESNTIPFNDILSGTMSPIYYERNSLSNNTIEHKKIINPEEIYENKYVEAIANVNTDCFQDIVNDIRDKSIIISKPDRSSLAESNLKTNTINLNELNNDKIENKEKVINNKINIVKETINNSIKNDYNIDDYKKMINMLKNIKNITKSTNITIEEAISISLINNYSLDDCIKFKQLLESNLN